MLLKETQPTTNELIGLKPICPIIA